MMQSSWLDKNIKWVFTLPAVLFVLLMMAFPIIYTVRISFFEWSMSAISPPKWVGLSNYITLLTDDRFWHSVKITFFFSVPSIVLETLVGVAISLLLSRNFKGKNAAKTILLLPMVATPVAMGLVWLLIYEPTIGIANEILKSIGFKPLVWLGSINQVVPSLIIIDVWEWTPMICLIVMAGMTTLPTEPYEAANVDGANAWQKIFLITLPMLRPTILVAVMLRLIDMLKAFDIIYATTQGGPNKGSETINLFGYMLAFEYFKLGTASSLLIIFFSLVLVVTLGMIWLRKRIGGQQ